MTPARDDVPEVRETLGGYFRDLDQAERAIVALRQIGFAQIGIFAHRVEDAKAIAERTRARPGIAASANSDGVLLRQNGVPDYSTPAQAHYALLAAGMPAAQASYFERRVEERGALVTVQAPSGRSGAAQRALEAAGADTGKRVQQEGGDSTAPRLELFEPELESAVPPPPQPPQTRGPAEPENQSLRPPQVGGPPVHDPALKKIDEMEKRWEQHRPRP